MKKKILFASRDIGGGGVQKSLVSLLQTIDYEENEVSILLNSIKGEFLEHLPKQVKVLTRPQYFDWIFITKGECLKEPFKAIRFNLNVFRYLFYLLRGIFTNRMTESRQFLWEKSRDTLDYVEGNYDIAIDYNGQMKNIILDKVRAKKKYTWIHSDYNVYNRNENIDRQEYQRLDKIIAVSSTCKKIFLETFPEMSEKCFVFENISNKQYIEELSNEKKGFEDSFDGYRILDITRLDPNKGLDKAIQVCQMLIQNGYRVRWYILGEGPERDNLEKLIKKLNQEKNFFLLGFDSNPYPYIKESDLIVHCSLFEGKSVAIDEAKLLGKPIILTDYPTAKDQITHGMNGLICGHSVGGIYKAVSGLLDNRALRQSLSNNLINEERSLEDVKKELNSILY